MDPWDKHPKSTYHCVVAPGMTAKTKTQLCIDFVAQCDTIDMEMVTVKGLVWDDWNREHIAKHGVTVEEVEEVCHEEYEAIESYRKRIQISGSTKRGRKLTIVLSPEDRELKPYGEGLYYPVTAFEEVRS